MSGSFIWWAIIGGATVLASLAWKFRLSNYEFKNRSGGGVVAFQSLVGSWLHGLSKLISTATLVFGGMLALIGVGEIFLR